MGCPPDFTGDHAEAVAVVALMLNLTVTVHVPDPR